MKNSANTFSLFQHPDELYDAPYNETKLQLNQYDFHPSPIQDVLNDRYGITILKQSGHHMRVESPLPRTIRIRTSPDNSCLRPSTTETLGLVKMPGTPDSFTFSRTDNKVSFLTNSLRFDIDTEFNEFSVILASGEELLRTINHGVKFSDRKGDFAGNRSLTQFAFEKENVFGFGGRIMHPNRTETTADIFSVKVGMKSGDYGGCPVPFFLNTKGYGFFFNNPWPHVYFDMGKTSKDQWFINAPGGEWDAFIFYGPDFSDIIRNYTEITGRIPIPPKHLLGFWCSSLTFTSVEQIIRDVTRLRQEGYPCDYAVLDGPWRGGPNFVELYMRGKEYISNDMDWHHEFGNGPSMINHFAKMGIKTCLHLNSRNFSQTTFESANGLLRKEGQEIVPKLLDADGEHFYETAITPRIKEGVEMWWTDHADRVSGQIRNGLPSRNLFGVLWNKLLSEIMAKNGKPNHLSLTRGSGIGGQKYGLPWPGDTRFGIDAFEEDIWFCLNAGIAGFSLTSVDLGGFASRLLLTELQDREKMLADAFDEENIVRRLCQSIFFIPVPRLHNNWDSVPKLPWNCPQTTQNIYKLFLQERYKLIPYIYSYAINSAETGEPILRPLYYHYQHDSNVYDIGDEFLMGDWLLIAPVTRAEQTSRRLYLPQGTWTHIWTDKQFVGPKWIEIETPKYELSGLPVFAKAGAIVPRQPFKECLEDIVPVELTLDLYPGNCSSYTLNEFPKVTSTMRCLRDGDNLIISLENMSNINRRYTLNIHNIHSCKITTTNSQPLQYEKCINYQTVSVLRINLSIDAISSIKIQCEQIKG